MTFVEAIPKALAALGRQGRPSNGVKDAAAPVVALDHDDAPGGLGSGRLTGMMGGGVPPG
jgi:hypothetical protein